MRVLVVGAVQLMCNVSRHLENLGVRGIGAPLTPIMPIKELASCSKHSFGDLP